MYHGMHFKIINVINNETLDRRNDRFYPSFINKPIIIELLEENLSMVFSFLGTFESIKTSTVEKISSDSTIVSVRTKNSTYILEKINNN